MASDRPPRHLLPLRETCNRCRELKVRCRGSCADLAASGAGSSCLRCLRAGAVCTFGPKQRSGRPRAVRGSHGDGLSLGARTPTSARQTSSSGSSPLSGASPPAYLSEQQPVAPFPWAELSPPGLLCEPLPGAGGLDLDDLASLLDERRASPITDAGRGGHGALAPQPHRPAPGGRSPREPRRQSHDGVAADMSELMGLNLRIYQLQAQAGTAPPALALCDDMASVTRSFLRTVERIADGPAAALAAPSHSHSMNDSLPTPPYGSDARRPHRQSIDRSIYVDDCEPDAMDASTFLLVVACYQRLIDLFKHVCLSIHAHMEDDTGAAEPLSSTAQVAMTTELISHLLGRLDRGLQRLTRAGGRGTALSATATSPSLSPLMMPPLPAPEAARSSVSSGWSAADGSGCTVSYDDLFSGGGAGLALADGAHPSLYRSCFPGVGAAIDAMARRQAALHAHIGIIKHIIQESDKF